MSARSSGPSLLRAGLSLLLLWELSEAARAEEAATAAPVVETSFVGIDDALTTGAGLAELQLTLGRSVATEQFDIDIPRARLDVATVTYTYGVMPRLDLTAWTFFADFEQGSDPMQHADGMGDLFVETKWLVHGDGVRGLNIAWRPGLGIPVGEDDDPNDPGLRFWSVNQALLVTWIAKRSALATEIGWVAPFGEERGRARGFASANCGWGYQLSSRLKPEIELNYARDLIDGPGDPRVLAVTAGVIVYPTARLRLDLGASHAVWGTRQDRVTSLSANVSWTLGN